MTGFVNLILKCRVQLKWPDFGEQRHSTVLLILARGNSVNADLLADVGEGWLKAGSCRFLDHLQLSLRVFDFVARWHVIPLALERYGLTCVPEGCLRQQRTALVDFFRQRFTALCMDLEVKLGLIEDVA